MYCQWARVAVVLTKPGQPLATVLLSIHPHIWTACLSLTKSSGLCGCSQAWRWGLLMLLCSYMASIFHTRAYQLQRLSGVRLPATHIHTMAPILAIVLPSSRWCSQMVTLCKPSGFRGASLAAKRAYKPWRVLFTGLLIRCWMIANQPLKQLRPAVYQPMLATQVSPKYAGGVCLT